jgi:hypothetical protein
MHLFSLYIARFADKAENAPASSPRTHLQLQIATRIALSWYRLPLSARAWGLPDLRQHHRLDDVFVLGASPDDDQAGAGDPFCI